MQTLRHNFLKNSEWFMLENKIIFGPMYLASLILLKLLVRIELTSAGYKAAVLPLNYNSE